MAFIRDAFFHINPKFKNQSVLKLLTLSTHIQAETPVRIACLESVWTLRTKPKLSQTGERLGNTSSSFRPSSLLNNTDLIEYAVARVVNVIQALWLWCHCEGDMHRRLMCCWKTAKQAVKNHFCLTLNSWVKDVPAGGYVHVIQLIHCRYNKLWWSHANRRCPTVAVRGQWAVPTLLSDLAERLKHTQIRCFFVCFFQIVIECPLCLTLMQS